MGHPDGAWDSSLRTHQRVVRVSLSCAPPHDNLTQPSPFRGCEDPCTWDIRRNRYVLSHDLYRSSAVTQDVRRCRHLRNSTCSHSRKEHRNGLRQVRFSQKGDGDRSRSTQESPCGPCHAHAVYSDPILEGLNYSKNLLLLKGFISATLVYTPDVPGPA